MSRIAIVTGGGSGIGRAVALELANANWRVVITGRRLHALNSVCLEAPDALSAFAADITQEGDVKALFAETAARHKRIDLLFNNAGTFGRSACFGDIELADWSKVIATNLTGAFLCAREAFRYMSAQSPQGGRIINNGSLSAQTPRPHAAAYTASKHAITGLTRQIALDGRPFNIACGQIDIGNAATELTADIAAGAMQADGAITPEPIMHVENAAKSVVLMANLPLEANIQFMTVMATAMPFVGRG